MEKNIDRASKLDPHHELIFKYWGKGKSLGFICRKLEQVSVFCNRSTVWRFIAKKRSI